ncbi:MAG: hemerythrin [Desulfuromonas sp.]|nr:MAG: hemerythrin [Desulfuromonas sp.]
MALFEWSKDYDLGVPEIDEQHHELINIINDLYESIKMGRSGSTVTVTLDRLVEYVESHFETEEEAMRKWSYPGYEEHREKHEDLRKKVHFLKDEQAGGREIATFELLNFLADWLKEHIAQVDREFGDFLHAKNTRNIL